MTMCSMCGGSGTLGVPNYEATGIPAVYLSRSGELQFAPVNAVSLLPCWTCKGTGSHDPKEDYSYNRPVYQTKCVVNT